MLLLVLSVIIYLCIMILLSESTLPWRINPKLFSLEDFQIQSLQTSRNLDCTVTLSQRQCWRLERQSSRRRTEPPPSRSTRPSGLGRYTPTQLQQEVMSGGPVPKRMAGRPRGGWAWEVFQRQCRSRVVF